MTICSRKYQGLTKELDKMWRVPVIIRDLCPEEPSPRNSSDTVQEPQAPRPLLN